LCRTPGLEAYFAQHRAIVQERRLIRREAVHRRKEFSFEDAQISSETALRRQRGGDAVARSVPDREPARCGGAAWTPDPGRGEDERDAERMSRLSFRQSQKARRDCRDAEGRG